MVDLTLFLTEELISEQFRPQHRDSLLVVMKLVWTPAELLLLLLLQPRRSSRMQLILSHPHNLPSEERRGAAAAEVCRDKAHGSAETFYRHDTITTLIFTSTQTHDRNRLLKGLVGWWGLSTFSSQSFAEGNSSWEALTRNSGSLIWTRVQYKAAESVKDWLQPSTDPRVSSLQCGLSSTSQRSFTPDAAAGWDPGPALSGGRGRTSSWGQRRTAGLWQTADPQSEWRTIFVSLETTDVFIIGSKLKNIEYLKV